MGSILCNLVAKDRLYFCSLVKRIQYISIWIAIFAVMLTTFKVYHRHYNRICTIQEICTLDGNINDGHTSHSQNEEDRYSLLRVHNFISNTSNVKNTYDTSISYFSYLSIISADIIEYCYYTDGNIIDYSNRCAALVQTKNSAYYSRRGPPIL